VFLVSLRLFLDFFFFFFIGAYDVTTASNAGFLETSCFLMTREIIKNECEEQKCYGSESKRCDVYRYTCFVPKWKVKYAPNKSINNNNITTFIVSQTKWKYQDYADAELKNYELGKYQQCFYRPKNTTVVRWQLPETNTIMITLTLCLSFGFLSATFVIGSFFYIILIKPKPRPKILIISND